MKKKFNWKAFAVVIILILISIFYNSYIDVVLIIVKNVITNSFFFYSITCISFIITIVHKYQTSFNFEEFVQPQKTKEIVSDIMTALTEPCTLISSLSILKGLFLDFFFQDSFFGRFQTGEKVFLLIVSSSFFIHSFLELRKSTTELLYKVEPIELK